MEASYNYLLFRWRTCFVVILVIVETFYTLFSWSSLRVKRCNPCYNGNLLHLDPSEFDELIGCNPCYNGNLLHQRMKSLNAQSGCNPCYNGNLLHQMDALTQQVVVVILVIMETFYTRIVL